MAAMGEGRTRFPCAEALLPETDLAPVTYISDRRRQVGIR
jgi:hypothetical protein